MTPNRRALLDTAVDDNLSKPLGAALLIAVTVLACSIPSSAQPAGTSLDELRLKIRAGWKSLRDLDETAGESEVVFNSKTVAVSKGKTAREFERSYKVQKRPGLYVIERPAALDGINQSYSFTLQRTGPDKDWVLAEASFVPNRESRDQSLLFSQYNYVLTHPLSSVIVSASPIDSLDKGSLVVRSSQPLPSGLVSVKFIWTLPPVRPAEQVEKLLARVQELPQERQAAARLNFLRQSRPTILEGTMSLDPNRSWLATECVSSLRETYSNTLLNRCRFTRVASEGADLRCLSAEYSTTYTDGEYVQTDTIKFGKTAPTFPDEGIFYLSYYNLPEPEGVTAPPSRRSRWVYFIIGAGFFLLLMVLFRWLHARARGGA